MTTPTAKQPNKRITSLVRRHILTLEKGRAKYDQANEILKKAISAGLMTDQPIEIELMREDGRPKTERFALVDNFTGKDVAYRPARLPRFELKRVPKNPRPPKPDPTEGTAA